MNVILLGVAISFAIWRFLSDPKKYLLWFFAVYPIVCAFWAYRIFGLSTIDLLTGIFPLMASAVVAPMIGSAQAGQLTGLYLLFLLTFAIHPAMEMLAGRAAMESASIFLKVACGFCAYNLSYRYFTIRDRTRVLRSLSIAIIITLVMSIGQLASGIGVQATEKAYIQGVYYDQGIYSRMALLGIALSLPFVSGKNTKRKAERVFDFRIFWSILLCSIVTMGYSISRNVILASICMLLAFAGVRRRPVIVILVACFCGVLWIVAPSLQRIIFDKFSTEIAFFDGRHNVKVEYIGSGRIGIWMDAYRAFQRGDAWQFWFGQGRGIGPHGQWIDLMLRNGVVGIVVSFVFYLLVWIKSLQVAVRHHTQLDSVIPLLIATGIWVLSIASAPFYTFLLQMALFSLLAIWEKHDLLSSKARSRTTHLSVLARACP